MKILFYLYFSLASLVPKKAMLGKWHVSFTWMFILTYLLYLGIFIFLQQLFHYKIVTTKLSAYLFGGGGGVLIFILLGIIIFRPAKLIHMRKKFYKIPKWLFKLSGILYILFCFIVGMGLGIVSTKLL
jgi:hypothetical protein